MKRIAAILLCALLVFFMLPTGASAASDEEVTRICNQIRTVYQKSYDAIGGNMQGLCGAMAGWELYFLGITDISIQKNGNQAYDVFSTTEHINPGYIVDCYPASGYTIEQALNELTDFGRESAYNILVGFQSTSTAAGSVYGHVTVVHAVLDGMVYFTEGFATPIQPDCTQPMICSIEEFANYYDSWATFEGLICFGNGDQEDGCRTYGCDVFVLTAQPVTLLTSTDPEQTEIGRTVPAGERLRAERVCQTKDGGLYYRVHDDGYSYYVPEQSVQPETFVYEDLQLEKIQMPVSLQKGEDFKFSGIVQSCSHRIHNAIVQIVDASGEIVLNYEYFKSGYRLDLGSAELDRIVNFKYLDDGSYVCNIYCNLVNSYCSDGVVMGQMEQVLLSSSSFTVGQQENTPANLPSLTQSDTQIADGWQYQNGIWRYRQNGRCRTGWYRENGVTYYFGSDAAAVTGWQSVNGKLRYFSETGAMRTGWMNTEQGSYYFLSNGEAVTGTRDIDGTAYCFDANGVLIEDLTETRIA